MSAIEEIARLVEQVAPGHYGELFITAIMHSARLFAAALVRERGTSVGAGLFRIEVAGGCT
jgi:hypothetical protein